MNARIRAILIICGVVLIDRLTKMWIQARVSQWDLHPVIPGFFNIVHTENPGAAFGALADWQSNLRPLVLIGISVVVIAIIAGMLFRSAKSTASMSVLMQTGLAFVFGGAVGNLWDRLFRGTVTDFLQFFFGSYEYPSFNAADSAIFVGAALLLIDLWMNRRKQEPRGLGEKL